MRRPAALLPALAALAFAGCGGGSTPARANTPHLGRVAGARVAVIIFENHEEGEVVGTKQAPYLTSLAHRWALATDYQAVSHPSLPNYVALLTGSTHGITSDCALSDCPVPGRSLADELGGGWRAYMEGLPRAGFVTSSDETGRYAQRHDPFIYLDRVRKSARRRAQIVPFTRLAGDERRGRLARFTWITPDLCNDMHDCSVATGDRWLRHELPALLRALGRRGVVFITFDEGTSGTGGGGRVATIAAGGLARSHTRWGRTVTHYGLLATIEDLLGVKRLGEARTAVTLSGLLRRP